MASSTALGTALSVANPLVPWTALFLTFFASVIVYWLIAVFGDATDFRALSATNGAVRGELRLYNNGQLRLVLIRGMGLGEKDEYELWASSRGCTLAIASLLNESRCWGPQEPADPQVKLASIRTVAMGEGEYSGVASLVLGTRSLSLCVGTDMDSLRPVFRIHPYALDPLWSRAVLASASHSNAAACSNTSVPILVSPNRRYVLLLTQAPDLVLYDASKQLTLWSASTDTTAGETCDIEHPDMSYR